MVEQVFLLLQVKRSVNNELPHELPNDLRLRILGNYEISVIFQNFIESLHSA